MFKKSAQLAFSILLTCVAMPPQAKAQLNSNAPSVTLSAPLLETLTVVAAPSTVSFVLVGSGTSTGSTAVSITTTWVLAVTRSNVKLYGYFASASAALTDGASHNIPTSAVLGSANSGAFTAVTEDGDPAYRSLDPSISVSLSAKSFRVAPHRAYTVFYRAQSAQLPAWFTIYASIAPPTAVGAVHLVIELPHTVYLLSRTRLRADQVSVSRAEIASDGRHVEAGLENLAGEFERVQEVELVGPSGKQTYAGFPFFPEQRRMLHLEWNGRGAVEKIIVKFSKFKIESTLRRSAPEL